MRYNVSNWYWNVAGSNSQVYSSAEVAYVPLNDVVYQAWLSVGNKVTNILNATELLEVLSNQWTSGYLARGVAVTSTSTPSLNATYALDPVSIANISAVSTGIAAGKGLPGQGSTFLYNGIEFTSDQFLALASALESYVYNFNLALATIVTTGTGSLPVTPLVIA